jgi:hypothetical protein
MRNEVMSKADQPTTLIRSRRAVDPVYAMIESHRAASRAFNKACSHPAIGDYSHPQNADAERVNNLAMQECSKYTKQLFAFRPSTSAGVVSLLRYISTLEVWEMPSCFNESDTVRGVKKFCKTMAAAIEALIKGGPDGKAVRS